MLHKLLAHAPMNESGKTIHNMDQNNATNTKVLVEISGGVDSAVCLHLLKEKGYQCIGAMMLLSDNIDSGPDIDSAKDICNKMNVKFKLIDLRKEFKNNVIDYFINTYKKAKTPNPCIVCNKTMKFGEMLKIANDNDCEKIATGHYAQIVQNEDKYELHQSKDVNKDQSYVLYFLDQNVLSRLLLPLGQITKKDVRSLAKKLNFDCADKAESQDICFIKDGNYSKFITDNTSYKNCPGKIVDTAGKVLGEHKGLINYTIGQRKGFGLAFGEPRYVTKLDAKNNLVVLGTKEETLQNEVHINNISWIGGDPPSKKFKCSSKLRYRQNKIKCECEINEAKNNATLKFKSKVSSVTPGQYAVIYDKNKVLGGGIIY